MQLLTLVSPAWAPPSVDAVLPPVASGVTCPQGQVLYRTGESVKNLVSDLDRFTATEVQTHEPLDVLGNAMSQERRKSSYLAEITQPRPGWLQVNEFRRDESDAGGFSDRIVTRGMLSLALVFHPEMRDSFSMVCEGLGEWQGQPAWLIHFRQRPDRPERLQQFQIGQNARNVELKGRAWIAAAKFQVVHIEAELVSPMPEVQLLSEHLIADYGPVDFKAKHAQLWLPQDTLLYLEYRGRRTRITDHFSGFMLFSVDATHQVKAPAAKN